MKFYDEISSYYDRIFPVNERQLSCIREAAGPPPASILDVACGSGGYAVALAGEGYDVTATDIDGEMVRITREKAAVGNVRLAAVQMDMLDFSSLGNRRFDCIFCIGNSLVHLKDALEIRKALDNMAAHLEKRGVLILQIINYDRILAQDVRSLPTITNGGISFERNYTLRKESGTISFDTVLTTSQEQGSKVIRNSVELFPLTSRHMESLLHDAGFKDVTLYGDFAGNAFFSDSSYSLVVVCR
ncbi:MAG: methyltransferase domain-containing protein [Clostridia bacterium]